MLLATYYLSYLHNDTWQTCYLNIYANCNILAEKISPFLFKRLFIESTLSCSPASRALHGTKSSPLFPAHHYWRQTAWEAVDRRTRKRKRRRGAEKRGMEEAGLGLVLITPVLLTWHKAGITWQVCLGSLWFYDRCTASSLSTGLEQVKHSPCTQGTSVQTCNLKG